jgi:putative ABC transport system permease protein
MDSLYVLITFADNILVQALLAFPLLVSVVISYRCLRVPDVTIDGASVFASAVCVLLMRQFGIPVPLAILIAVLAGFLAGIVTGVMIEVFRINGLLAGILNAFIFYSLSLLLINAALDFEQGRTVFAWLKDRDTAFAEGLPTNLIVHPYLLTVLALIAIVTKWLVDWLLSREWGVVLRGAGSNELVLQLKGVNTKRTKILGFGVANALVGLGATLISMYEGSVQAMRWPATIIFALSVCIVGWESARHLSRILRIRISDTSAVFLGAVLYFVVVRVCYSFYVPSSLPRLVIALYIVAVLAEKKNLWRNCREALR